MIEEALSGRCALVTGSNRGIGNGIANGFWKAGTEVIFHGRTDRSPQVPAEAVFLKHDLMQLNNAATLIEDAFSKKAGLDILVSNAGSFFDVPFLEMTPERWQETMDLNLRSVYFLVQAFAKRLIDEHRGGAVIIVSSTNAFQSELDSSAYDTSKGGLVSLTRALALELADHKIRVNGIAPGLIRTPLTERWINDRPDLVAHYEKNIPLGRIGKSEDCAGAAVFLASDAAAYITGHVVVIDGGLTAQQVGPL
jgi:NAD(P)-dependent dehydrogenase (short-subunit alcohol dehydrogenase family)